MVNSKKRLALFLPALYGGGAERVMLNLASGLSGNGYVIDLVLAQAEGPYVTDVPASVRLVELNVRHRRTMRSMFSLPNLLYYLRTERPDVLLSALHANIVILWARLLTGLPRQVIISEHNTFSQKRHQLRGLYRFMPFLMRLSYPWADRIVAVSEGVADDLSQIVKIPRHRIQVIHNPVVTPEVRCKAKEVLDHTWFKPNEPPVVLAVGRLTPQKDFTTLIRAFSLLRRNRSVRLMILGEGEQRSDLQELVTRLDLDQDISLPGFIRNPYPYMVQASVFVLSSRWEGLPTVLVEALYCGCSIVSTDCPSGPRKILQDGKYGLLVPVGDVQLMARAIDAKLREKAPYPFPESWQPFELDAVVNQYRRILFVS